MTRSEEFSSAPTRSGRVQRQGAGGATRYEQAAKAAGGRGMSKYTASVKRCRTGIPWERWEVVLITRDPRLANTLLDELRGAPRYTLTEWGAQRLACALIHERLEEDLREAGGYEVTGCDCTLCHGGGGYRARGHAP